MQQPPPLLLASITDARLETYWIRWLSAIEAGIAHQRRRLFEDFWKSHPNDVQPGDVDSWVARKDARGAVDSIALLGATLDSFLASLSASGYPALAREIRKTTACVSANDAVPLKAMLAVPHLRHRWTEWIDQIFESPKRRRFYAQLGERFTEVEIARIARRGDNVAGERGIVYCVAEAGLTMGEFDVMLAFAGFDAMRKAMHQVLAPAYSECEYATCSVCFERTRDTAFWPCKHFGYCWQCTSGLKECPQCRTRGEPLKLFSA